MLFVARLAFPQKDNSLEYFPHSVGDYWEYQVSDRTGSDVWQYTILNKSIDKFGNILLNFQRIQIQNMIVEEFSYYIDKNNSVINCSSVGQDIIEIKLNSVKGEEWLSSTDTNINVRLDSIYAGECFGKETTFKVFGQYQTKSGKNEDTKDQYLGSSILAKGFGYVEMNGINSPTKRLQGCIINDDTLGILTTVQGVESVISESFLSPNYPNPFNSTTTIEYKLSKGSQVLLEVRDLLGRQVAIVENGYREAGEYRINFNVRDYPVMLTSGFFVCSLEIGKRKYNQKMLFIQ